MAPVQRSIPTNTNTFGSFCVACAASARSPVSSYAQHLVKMPLQWIIQDAQRAPGRKIHAKDTPVGGNISIGPAAWNLRGDVHPAAENYIPARCVAVLL